MPFIQVLFFLFLHAHVYYEVTSGDNTVNGVLLVLLNAWLFIWDVDSPVLKSDVDTCHNQKISIPTLSHEIYTCDISLRCHIKCYKELTKNP